MSMSTPRYRRGLGTRKTHKCGETIWKVYLPDYRGECHLWFLNERRTPLPDSRCPRCGALIVVTDLIDSVDLPVSSIDSDDSGRCTSCGSRLDTIVPCPNCGEMLCQDCLPPFGSHSCDPD